LAFLSIFHVLGGGGLGVALRPLRTRSGGTQDDRVSVPLAIWGLMFGGIPLLMAVEVPWLLPLQLLEMVVGFLATFLFWDHIRELLGQGYVLLILFGGVFFMAGSAASGMLLKEGDLWKGLLIGMLFGGLGLGMVILGLRRTFRPPPDPDDE
jgi:hypothetical protein